MIKRVGEKEVFRAKFMTIKDVELESPKGKVTYQIIEKRDTALIVPVTSNLEVIFIKEFFVAINEYSLSLPKGRIDEGHDALETANKELQEEVGFKANKLEKVATLTMSPGYLTQKTHVFLATDLIESKLEGDELEPLEIIRYPLKDFEKLIEKNDLHEARTIAALYLVREKLNSFK